MKKFNFILIFTLISFKTVTAQQVGSRPGYNFYPAFEKGIYGYINSTGQWMINPKFEWCNYFYDGRAVAKEKGKFGFIDIKGNWIGKPIYDTVGNFSEGYASIAQRNEDGILYWGFIDTAGNNLKLKFPALSGVTNFSNGISVASESGFLNFFFINRKGEIAFEAKEYYLDENKIATYSENLLHVYIGSGSSTFIDTAGVLWEKGQFEDCGDFHEGMAWIAVNQKFGFVNMNGEIIIPTDYDSVGNFSDGIALVKMDMKYDPQIFKLTGGHVAYIDKEGKKITPPVYTDGTAFSDGYAFVNLNGLYGFIDKNGKVVIDYQFETGSNFFRGLAYVKKENHWEYINTNGNKVW